MKIIEITNHHQFDGVEIDRNDFNKLKDMIQNYSKYSATITVINDDRAVEKHFV
jgi:hypothetical protein